RPDGHRTGDPATGQTHDGPLEDLDPLAVAFDDLGRDLDRVTGRQWRKVGSNLVGDDVVENAHGCTLTRVLEGARTRARDRQALGGRSGSKAGGARPPGE